VSSWELDFKVNGSEQALNGGDSVRHPTLIDRIQDRPSRFPFPSRPPSSQKAFLRFFLCCSVVSVTCNWSVPALLTRRGRAVLGPNKRSIKSRIASYESN
jgi:hypothetical protein